MKKDNAQCLRTQRSLSRFNLASLAKASGWMTRQGGKISALEFCSAILEATKISTASLRIVAFLSGTFSSTSVSKQAIHKRINTQARDLFESLLSEAISQKARLESRERKLGFSRIVVQDSTSIALPKHLREGFRGSGNTSGGISGLKIHASFDLLGKRFARFEIREQRSPDQSFALEGVEGLGEGDLLLRDLGYFSIGSFRELEKNNAHMLSRWQPNVLLMDPENMDTIDLLALLRSESRIDRDVLAGGEERLAMRLVAFRVPKTIAEKRRRRVREKSKRKGRTPSRKLLDFQDWQIYLTTCERAQLGFDEVFELYSQRWAIEILFKGFKSHMKIDRIPPAVRRWPCA